MTKDFDPYHKWLGIPQRDQPADHYRLLGVERFEDDADVISLAADQRMHFLRSFQNGERAKLSQQLLNEIAAARVCLLDEKKKAAYDAELEQKTAGATQSKPASAETPVEDLAATLEFAAPEMASDWTPGPVADSNAANLWSPKSESSKDELAVSKTQGSPKTKTRVLIVSLLSSLALLLFLGVVIAGVGREADETAQNDVDTNGLVNISGQTDQETEVDHAQELEVQRAEQTLRDFEKKAAQKAKEEAKQKAEKEKVQRAKEEAQQRAEEEAERQAVRRELRRKRNIEDLSQKVSLSIKNAERLKYSPDKAMAIIRDCGRAVEAADIPTYIKRGYIMQLRRKEGTIAKIAAAQKEKQQIEAEKKWRKEHPDQYLESLGLVKEKNAWEIEAALKLNEMKDPLAKLISEYKKKSTELKIKQRQINNLESKLLNDMQKLPGAFKNEEFREWVLNGRRRFGNESNRTRQMLDEWTRQYDHFRAQAPALANKLEQKVSQLQSAKNQLQENKRSLQDTLHEMEDLDQRAHELLQSIKETEQQLAEKKRNIDSALQSTGLGLEEPNTTNVENLLKKVKGILDDDLIKSLPDRRPDRR